MEGISNVGGGFWDTSSTGLELTRELLEKAFEQMKNAPTDPCRLGRHVVSATALREKWKYARCGNCGGIVKLTPE